MNGHIAAEKRSEHMGKSVNKQQAEVDIINAFLDLCAASLAPEMMDAMCDAVMDLCDARHVDKSLIHPWAVDAYDCANAGPSAMDECPV